MTVSFQSNCLPVRAMRLEEVILALSKLPQDQQIRCILNTKEIQPLIRTHGLTTIAEALHLELSAMRNGKYSMIRERMYTLHKARRTYRLLHVNASNQDYTLPVISVFDGTVRIDNVKEPRTKVDPTHRAIHWSRHLSNGLFEHGQIVMCDHEFSGQGALLISNNSTHRTTLGKLNGRIIAFRAEKASSVDKLQSQDNDSYNMTMDLDAWPNDIPIRTNPKNPVHFGMISYEIQNTNPSQPLCGMSYRVIKVPILDRLCSDINSVFQDASTQPLESLYNSTVDLSDSSIGNLSTSIVTLTCASLIAQLADKNQNNFNLTFKEKLKSDVVLPLLFQEIQVQSQDNSLKGAIFEYDPAYRGSLGIRHLIVSEPVSELDATTFDQTESILGISARATTPSPVTILLGDAGALSVDGLITNTEYSEVAVHQTTQDLILKTMYYYMDGKQRQQLLNIPDKPTDLPLQLLDGVGGISIDLQAWLRDIYAPAYIVNTLCLVQPTVSGQWSDHFSDAEKIKCQYWWTGKGENCLANSELYNSLTTIASRCAMLQVCPSLEGYLEDGPTWAQRLVDSITAPDCLRSVLRTPISGGTNFMNKFSNILTTLDKSTEHANTLFQCIYEHSLSTTVCNPYINVASATSMEATEWFTETLTTLGTQILATTPPPGKQLEISNELKLDLQEDLESLESFLGLPTANKSATERITAIVKSQTTFISTYSVMASPMSALGSDAFRVDVNLPSWDLGSTFLTWAKQAYYQASDRLFPEGSPNATLLTGIFTLVMASRHMWLAIRAYSKWDMDDPVQKSIVVFTSLQGILSLVQGLYKTWLAFKAYTQILIQRVYDWYIGAAFAAKVAQRGALESAIELMDLNGRAVIGDNPLQITVEAQLAEHGQPPAGDIIQAIENGTTELTVVESDTAKSIQAVARDWNTTTNWISGATIILNIGIVISLSVQLAEQWSTLTTAGKILETIQVAITGLSIFCTVLVAQAVEWAIVWAGFALVGSPIVTAMPYCAGALLVVGLIILCIELFVTMKKTPPVPPSPVDIFIGKMHSVIKNWDDQPPQVLSYTTTDTSAPQGDVIQYKVLAYNNSLNRVNLQGVTFTFQDGLQPADLFIDLGFDVVSSLDVNRMNEGNIFLDDPTLKATVVTSPNSDTDTSFDLKVSGISTDENPAGLITLNPGFNFLVTITGKISSAVGTSMMQITESLMSNDSSYSFLLTTKY